MSPLRKLFVHFSHFLSGSALSLLLSFITFPILTRLLSREDYGILGLVTSTLAISVALAKFGLSDSIIRFYNDHARTPGDLKIFTSTVLVRGATFVLIAVFIYIVAIPYITVYMGMRETYVGCFLVMAIYLFARPLNIIVLNYMRAQGRTRMYNMVNFITKALATILALGLLLYVLGDLFGYFLGTALAELAATVYLYHWLLSRHAFSTQAVSGELAIRLIKFGTPLLLTEISYLLFVYVDRYMIVAYLGENALGLYMVGYNLPSYINNLLMFSLSYAVVPIYTQMYVNEGRVKTEEFLSKAFYYYIMVIMPLCAGYFAITRDLIVTLASAKYEEAATFSPIVLVGLVFLGMNSITNAGLYLEKKSIQILFVMITAVVVNVAANIILLPFFGLLGAAIASMLAGITASVLTIVLSFRYLRVQVRLGMILYYAIVSFLMYFAVIQIQLASVWASLAARLAAGAAITIIAILWREKDLREKLNLARFSGRPE